jgi:hypothetical protein
VYRLLVFLGSGEGIELQDGRRKDKPVFDFTSVFFISRLVMVRVSL